MANEAVTYIKVVMVNKIKIIIIIIIIIIIVIIIIIIIIIAYISINEIHQHVTKPSCNMLMIYELLRLYKSAVCFRLKYMFV